MSYFSGFASQLKTPATWMILVLLHHYSLYLSEYIIPLLETLYCLRGGKLLTMTVERRHLMT